MYDEYLHLRYASTHVIKSKLKKRLQMKISILKKILLIGISALLCLSLVGCKVHKLTPDDLAVTPVGTVGGYEVTYDELYFLANSYYTEGMSEDELKTLVYDNIRTHYAILALCEKYGVDIDSDELFDEVDAYVNEVADGLGGASSYKEFLKESSSTDNFTRFTVRCNLLYEKLPLALATAGELLIDEDEVCEYIVNNFVRTRHFMVANNEGDDPAANLAVMEKALKDLRAEKTTIYELIGGKYNEDLLIPGDGYTFGKGSMEQAYEDAAFALEVEEVSDIVTAMGRLASGEYVECYYIIERLDLTKEFVKENYEDLELQYSGSVAAQMVEDKKNELSFTPNEFGASLKLTDLDPVGPGTDVFLIVSLCVWALVAVIAVVAFILIRRKMKANSAARLEIKRAALANKPNRK